MSKRRVSLALPRALLLATAGLVLVAALASAHDTWLLADRQSVPVGTRLTLSMTSGMAFPKNETRIDPTRLKTATARLAGQSSALRPMTSSQNALRLQAVLTKPGVATIWASLKPRTLELTPKQVTEYLDEIGAPDSVRRLYVGVPQPPRWRERYTKYTKTYVAVGQGVRDSSWREPAGIGLEIVPLTDPTTIGVGDTLTIRVLRGGVPAPAFPISDVFAAEVSNRLVRTDSNGAAKLPAVRAGLWMLRGTDLRRPPSDVDADWESMFSTLTLRVTPRRTR